MTKLKFFKSPDKNYIEGNFKKIKHPRTPSPKKASYNKLAKIKEDKKTRCTYIHPETGKRCKHLLGLYPEYCELHTMMINNVYIAKSNIENAGNGLYAGPYGFKKGDIIGRYSFKWNEAKLKQIYNRCKNDKCWSYVFCKHGSGDNLQCWDGVDIRSTLMRNINDAHGSNFHNNSYFDIIKNQVYVIASRNIKPHKELFVSYGKKYWS